MGALSPMHILVIVLVALLLFGPRKLPELGRGVGRMFREFKDAANGNEGNANNVPRDMEPAKKDLTASSEKPSAH